MAGPFTTFRPPGSRLDPGYAHTIPGTIPTPGRGQVSGLPPNASAQGHPRPDHVGPTPREVLEQEIAARITCGDWAGLLAFGLDALCGCLVAKLHATQIGARLSGAVSPPPGATALFAVGGVADSAPISLPAAGAWTTVATAQVPKGQCGVVRGIGVGLEDAFFWPTTQWKLLRNGAVVMGPWTGGFGALDRPAIIGPFTSPPRSTWELQGSNGHATLAVNAMAVIEGWQFVTIDTPDEPWKAYMRDQG